MLAWFWDVFLISPKSNAWHWRAEFWEVNIRLFHRAENMFSLALYLLFAYWIVNLFARYRYSFPKSRTGSTSQKCVLLALQSCSVLSQKPAGKELRPLQHVEGFVLASTALHRKEKLLTEVQNLHVLVICISCISILAAGTTPVGQGKTEMSQCGWDVGSLPGLWHVSSHQF